MLTNAAKYDVDDGALLQEIQQLGGYNHKYGIMSIMAKNVLGVFPRKRCSLFVMHSDGAGMPKENSEAIAQRFREHKQELRVELARTSYQVWPI